MTYHICLRSLYKNIREDRKHVICFAFPFTILEVPLLPEKQGQREWERRVTNMSGSKIER